jgi:predicted Zn-dependent protease
MDLAAAPSFMPADKFDPAIIHDDHEAQMEDVAQVVRLASERGLDAAGYILSRVQQEVVINSTGLEAFSLGTQAGAAITMRRVAAHLETSGYGAIASWQAEAVRLDDLSVAVANKAIWGGAPERIPPGEYTVILEPLAVAELLLFLADGFNARSVEENDSFLTGKLGERCFSPCLTLLDDFSHPLQSGVPFDGEGWPRNKVTLINAGRVSELLYDRATAARMGAAPTGHGLPIPNPDGAQAANLVLVPGEHSNEALVSGCERGILVTRFWYVRPVDPGTMTLTGLTRDGTFLIEEGHVVRRLADLRWNESLLRAFARLDAVGRQTAVVPMEETTVVAPAVRIPGFRFVS